MFWHHTPLFAFPLPLFYNQTFLLVSFSFFDTHLLLLLLLFTCCFVEKLNENKMPGKTIFYFARCEYNHDNLLQLIQEFQVFDIFESIITEQIAVSKN